MRHTLFLYYTTLKSPVGTLHLGVTKNGVCCVAWNSKSWKYFLEKTGRRYSINISYDMSRCKVIVQELEKYFAGTLKQFSAQIDMIPVTPFEKKVLTTAQKIEYGSVVTYKELAVKAGSPKASRAVGNALGSNPIPIVVPCHRIIKSDNTLGGYGGGFDVKDYLLSYERDSSHQIV